MRLIYFFLVIVFTQCLIKNENKLFDNVYKAKNVPIYLYFKEDSAMLVMGLFKVKNHFHFPYEIKGDSVYLHSALFVNRSNSFFIKRNQLISIKSKHDDQFMQKEITDPSNKFLLVSEKEKNMFFNRIELAKKIQETLYEEVENQLEPPFDLDVLGYTPIYLKNDDLMNKLELEVKFRWRKFYSVNDSKWNWVTFNLEIENNQFKIISSK